MHFSVSLAEANGLETQLHYNIFSHFIFVNSMDTCCPPMVQLCKFIRLLFTFIVYPLRDMNPELFACCYT